MATLSQSPIMEIEGKQFTISNPDKLLWPEAGVSKLDYLTYLLEVAPFLLPYTRNRLLTVVRYPHGVDGKHFYQKNVPTYAPEWIATTMWENTRYAVLNDLPTLIWLGNQAALEWHVSFHETNDEIPTELVFDLDPSTPDFADAIDAALKLKEVLDELNLPSWIKTSGASGLQVYVPIERKYRFAQTRQVGEFIARYLVSKYPRRLTLERLVKKRGSKLYIDYLQHWRGKTLVAPYSTRATPQATVSAPLRWEEVPSVHPTQFTVHTMPGRLKQTGDLFRPLLSPLNRVSLDPILSFLAAR